ncbi:PII-like signaling protein [Asanoa ferruginea]|uniref:PII-like signaling protein n=1 Tax=Asanoa ferruginea TaxID=53367 RepID=A0A3D9ZVH3_9ACTN|nr:DUF190 domain-containing protein [Asanoa ferruginea]REG01188.1 PII-like signaling protein [Asanoa ferruginea]GIF47102.1 hypothetical protein Afe04nite_16410 [Asanoa ferruginea]
MNADCLKLTCYFGERHRTGTGFVADELLALYGRHRIATSIVLRGIEGFGLKHHLRSDHSLTLSEDLPAVTVAVDTRPRIEAIVDQVAGMPQVGLVTLERARLLQGDVGPVRLPEALHEATKLTVYVGRQQRIHGAPAFVAVCDLLHRHGVAGATVLLGVDGTVGGQRERARFIGRNHDVPMMIIAVGSGDRIGRALPDLAALLDQPRLTLERVRLCKRDGRLIEEPQALPATDARGLGLWQKLTIFTSEAGQHEGQPIHRALVRRLRAGGSSGATTVRGIWGFHGDHRPHGDRFFQLGRRVPAVTIVIDTADRISGIFPIVDELTAEQGLVVSELVPAVHARAGDRLRGGLRLADHRW